MYKTLLILYCVLLTAINFFYGFGEDPDSLRIVLAGVKYMNGFPQEVSRSWGFPLYESVTYLLIASGKNGLLLAKLASLCYSIGAMLIFHAIVKSIVNSKVIAFLITLVYCSNPLLIISGNSIMETSMHLLVMSCICYFIFKVPPKWAGDKILPISVHLFYGILMGIATLVRPDNLIYFPSFYLYLLVRANANIKIKPFVAAALTALLIGLTPYYFSNYPLFSSLPGEVHNHLLTGIKTMVLIVGLPMCCLGMLLLYRRRHVLKALANFKKRKPGEKDHFGVYLLILLAFVLFRVFVMPDELEYGLLSWSILLLLFAYLYKKQPVKKYVLVLMTICTLLPNFIQLYLFRETNYNYYFSAGLTAGVLHQEKERRLYAASLLQNGAGMLHKYVDSRFPQQKPARALLYYDQCVNCIVYTTYRELQAYKRKGLSGTSLDTRRIVVYPVFNVSRGWRNFIKDEKIPTVNLEQLVLAQ